MYYVICYDIENDRLRDRTAKVLIRNGCLRIQKSVFVAPEMAKKHLNRLETGLKHLYARYPLQGRDSVCIFPLTNESTTDVATFGLNNVVTLLQPIGLKIIL